LSKQLILDGDIAGNTCTKYFLTGHISPNTHDITAN